MEAQPGLVTLQLCGLQGQPREESHGGPAGARYPAALWCRYSPAVL